MEINCSLSSLNFPTQLDSQTHHLLHSFASPMELKQLHAGLMKNNISLSTLPLPRVAAVCSGELQHLAYANQIFDSVQKPRVVVWNSCLKDLAEGDCPLEALLLFYKLRECNVLPDTFTCSFVLKACTKLLDLANGRIIHGYIEKLGFRWNLVLDNIILNLYSLCGEMGDAQKLFDTMPHRDVITWNTMISQLSKRGDVERAHKYFLKMPERSVRSWTVMISGFAQCKKPEEAIRLFIEMEKEAAEIKPNEVTTVAVLGACADLGALDLGRQIHKKSDLSGFRKNIHISNTLIEMYVKCGCLEDALKVFKNMEERTVVSYSAMISGLALHGKAEDALRLFNRMIRSGIKPNGVTFVGVLHACSHMGLVTEGRELFARMIGDYGIVPEIEHYGCMVDLYSRAGHLQEAREFITNMPVKPNGVIWGTLLGGCRVHKNIELAEETFRHLSYLDPQNDGYYILMSNIYADSHRWEEAAIVRKLMKFQGVKKTPGWSSITINGEIHKFVAGDDSHVQCEDIKRRWEILLGEMKLQGYVPNTSVVLLDMEESEKVKTLYSHSEKLALVFGLINTKPGKTIRIMKNLRVCEDCHAAFKILSGVVKREIVVRDRNRFHSFKDGSCSCKDYW